MKSLTTDLSEIHRNVVVNMEAERKAPGEPVFFFFKKIKMYDIKAITFEITLDCC